jgi:hypothetical protein
MSSPFKDKWNDPKVAREPFQINELARKLLLPSTDAFKKLLNKKVTTEGGYVMGVLFHLSHHQ